jgi:transposase-like protein
MKMGTEFWEGHVAAAKRETISASEYARRHGISVAALYYWQHKLKITTASTPNKVSKLAKPAHASSFVELRVLDKQVMAPCLCTLVLSSELRLEMSALPEPSWLVALEYAMQGTR